MISSHTRILVRRRARGRCEYCRLAQSAMPLPVFHIEHILPRQHGGGDDFENLCLACSHCNSHKGTNLTGIDPRTGEIVLLFHPRRHDWSVHFSMVGLQIKRTTPMGRATVAVLAMNDDDRIRLRRDLTNEGSL